MEYVSNQHFTAEEFENEPGPVTMIRVRDEAHMIVAVLPPEEFAERFSPVEE